MGFTKQQLACSADPIGVITLVDLALESFDISQGDANRNFLVSAIWAWLY